LVPAPRGTGADHNSACFIVKDANRLAVAYVYCEEEPASLLSRDEATNYRLGIMTFEVC
jgi:hypothetical protein